MGEMGDGYGSEWHLLRYLGRHRHELDRAILAEVRGSTSIDWLDFGFDPASSFGDREPRGLSFLDDYRAKAGWNDFWPTTGSPQNWDAIAELTVDGRREWLLVEAKANVEEIYSSCGANERGAGRQKIAKAMEQTKLDLGIGASSDWLNEYYQYANRLAVLSFLDRLHVPTRLLYVYFTGDRNGDRTCPADEDEWREALAEQDAYLGLTSGHRLSDRVHKIHIRARRGLGRKGQRPSVAELMGPVIGIVDSGISDLATNPKHMEDFGLDSMPAGYKPPQPSRDRKKKKE